MSALVAHLNARFGAQRVERGLFVAAALMLATGATVALAPNGLPAGVVLLGVMLGAMSSLLAMGLVLIYRANRFINFAHGPMGLIAGVSTALVVVELEWNFWLALPAGIALGGIVGAFTERLVITRFRQAPRIIVTVASIGLAQLYTAVQAIIPALAGNVAPNYQVPLDATWEVFPLVFNGSYLFAATVVPACVIALAWFLQRTRYGVAVRAIAQNEERAQGLGVPARTVSLIVWVIAGALAAVGGILAIPVFGYAIQGTAQGPSVFLLALAAAVIANMRSLPVTFGSSIVLGVAYQGIFWNVSSSSITDVVTLGIIAATLLVRLRRSGRAEEATTAATWSLIEPIRPLSPQARNHPRVVIATRVGLVGAAAAAAALPMFLSPSRAQLTGAIVAFGLAAISLAIVSGLVGRVSLGHWAIVGVSAAAAAWGAQHGGVIVALLAAVTVGTFSSVAIGLPSLRLSGLFYAVSTLAFAVPAQTWILKRAFGIEPVAAPSLFGIELGTQRGVLYLGLALLAGVLVVVFNLQRSSWGRRLVAVRENTRTARAHGIRPTRAVLTAYALSGAVAGLAGFLYLYNQRILDSDTFDAGRSLVLLTMVVVGGLGSIPGALLGAVAVQGATFFLDGNYQLLGTGAGLLFVLLFLPSGLGRGLYAARDAVVGRLMRDDPGRGTASPGMVKAATLEVGR